MRRKENELSAKQAQIILSKSEWGVLSLSLLEEPYGVPINYAYDEEENVIYFHSAKEGKKLDIIRNNPSAAFTVVGNESVQAEKYSTSYQSVMALGKVAIMDEGDEKLQAMILFCNRFVKSEDNHSKVINAWFKNVEVLKFQIETLTGKQNY